MEVDALAKKVFCGGSNQVLIVRPWEIGGADWPCKATPLPRGNFWDVLQYEPTLLCRAAFEGNLDALASASQEDLSQHSPVMGFTPFHHAAIAGDAGAIDALSKAGADAGSMNHMGITPLMLASVC